jgi:hypothetical protein
MIHSALFMLFTEFCNTYGRSLQNTQPPSSALVFTAIFFVGAVYVCTVCVGSAGRGQNRYIAIPYTYKHTVLPLSATQTVFYPFYSTYLSLVTILTPSFYQTFSALFLIFLIFMLWDWV